MDTTTSDGQRLRTAAKSVIDAAAATVVIRAKREYTTISRSVSSDETWASSNVPPMSQSRHKRGSESSSSGLIGKAFKAAIVGGTEGGNGGMKEHVKHAMAEEMVYRVGETISGKLRSAKV